MKVSRVSIHYEVWLSCKIRSREIGSSNGSIARIVGRCLEAKDIAYQAITKTNVGFRISENRWHSQQVPELSDCNISLKIILLKSLPQLPEANELTKSHVPM